MCDKRKLGVFILRFDLQKLGFADCGKAIDF